MPVRRRVFPAPYFNSSPFLAAIGQCLLIAVADGVCASLLIQRTSVSWSGDLTLSLEVNSLFGLTTDFSINAQLELDGAHVPRTGIARTAAKLGPVASPLRELKLN